LCDCVCVYVCVHDLFESSTGSLDHYTLTQTRNPNIRTHPPTHPPPSSPPLSRARSLARAFSYAHTNTQTLTLTHSVPHTFHDAVAGHTDRRWIPHLPANPALKTHNDLLDLSGGRWLTSQPALLSLAITRTSSIVSPPRRTRTYTLLHTTAHY
jgi:hypothetical protein